MVKALNSHNAYLHPVALEGTKEELKQPGKMQEWVGGGGNLGCISSGGEGGEAIHLVGPK